tara:strand:+ start:489 stop:929 length:441 start_codon:yes stop_codon:yes gene_type:complete
MPSTPIATARRLHSALEAGSNGEALRAHFTPNASTIEHPNAIKPHGATATLDQMLAASSAGARLLGKQHYEVIDAVEYGELAVLRILWTGAIAEDAGPFRAGQELRAHIAQFITTEGDRISRIETFDCYEPFQVENSSSGLTGPTT